MRNRANGIDIMSADYVHIQNEVFQALAVKVGAEILTHRRNQPMGAWLAQVRATIFSEEEGEATDGDEEEEHEEADVESTKGGIGL
ncbi:hypothetical protein GNI_205340 [Gregarina niphandrodes]|uniref:Uncharacterized protein n=1 Tax=Gregarina niphandrodes TaxID=110365 RepID=A0A023AWZ8_GRENI|nr:hypothetical protein GNI_205340 [Gregarina niphandrodes]EZG42943.1 hypothetical protein GNI_205340 [Gregarina niphandrodes]|eukprot:XP_011133781.1 hypothetical protein GNI_205340 [Gregarina niphandrodes]